MAKTRNEYQLTIEPMFEMVRLMGKCYNLYVYHPIFDVYLKVDRDYFVESVKNGLYDDRIFTVISYSDSPDNIWLRG